MIKRLIKEWMNLIICICPRNHILFQAKTTLWYTTGAKSPIDGEVSSLGENLYDRSEREREKLSVVGVKKRAFTLRWCRTVGS